jgi:hypothetical protein
MIQEEISPHPVLLQYEFQNTAIMVLMKYFLWGQSGRIAVEIVFFQNSLGCNHDEHFPEIQPIFTECFISHQKNVFSPSLYNQIKLRSPFGS